MLHSSCSQVKFLECCWHKCAILLSKVNMCPIPSLHKLKHSLTCRPDTLTLYAQLISSMHATFLLFSSQILGVLLAQVCHPSVKRLTKSEHVPHSLFAQAYSFSDMSARYADSVCTTDLVNACYIPLVLKSNSWSVAGTSVPSFCQKADKK